MARRSRLPTSRTWPVSRTNSCPEKPGAAQTLALTPAEIAILDRLTPARKTPGDRASSLATYTHRLARLGGYLDRSHDPPPGNTVLWRGLARLNDILLGTRIAQNVMGN